MTDIVQIQQPPCRSPFVTVCSWISIVCSGASLAGALFYGALFFMFVKAEPTLITKFQKLGWQAPAFLAAYVILPALGIIASVGLLKRRNWARVLYIILLVLSSCYLLFTAMTTLVQGLPSHLGDVPVEQMPDLQNQFRIIRFTQIGGSVFALIVAVACSLLIKKLLSAPIREEFRRKAALGA